MKRIFANASAVISAIAVIAGCTKADVNPAKDNVIRMTVSLDKPVVTSCEDSRIAVSGTSLSWEGNESVGVIFATSAESKTTYKQELKTVPGCPGVFAGNVNLGNYTADDIVGIVYPYSEESWGRNNSGLRIVMQTSTADQTQARSGELNCANAKIFAEVNKSDFKVSGDSYTLEGKQLKWASSFLQCNVYGKHAEGRSGEKLISVEVNSTATVAFVGTAEWKLGGTAFVFNGAGDGNQHIRTLLSEPAVIGAEVSEAASVFVSTLPRSSSSSLVEFTKIKVVTDCAIYQKTISQKPKLTAGNVIPVGLNLASFERTATDRLSFEVSFDGGQTWTKDIPASFTSLMTKGELTVGQAAEIGLAVKKSTQKVDVDLSGSTMATPVWPKAAFLSTADEPNASLKSIKFPSNVNEIEAGASGAGAFSYCTALESIDLTQFEVIGRDAFCYTGLKSVTIPNTVKTIGNQAFRWCFNIGSVYFNAEKVTGTYLFGGGDAYVDNPHAVDMVVTIGPDVESVPNYMVFGNPNLSKVIFEGSPAIGQSVLSKSKWLKTIEFKSVTPPTQAIADKPFYATTTSANVTEGKQLIVPEGAVEAYKAEPWGTFATTLGYEIVESK